MSCLHLIKLYIQDRICYYRKQLKRKTFDDYNANKNSSKLTKYFLNLAGSFVHKSCIT